MAQLLKRIAYLKALIIGAAETGPELRPILLCV
jgi:hypothetical protein